MFVLLKKLRDIHVVSLPTENCFLMYEKVSWQVKASNKGKTEFIRGGRRQSGNSESRVNKFLAKPISRKLTQKYFGFG